MDELRTRASSSDMKCSDWCSLKDKVCSLRDKTCDLAGTNATRDDQDAYARGTITAAELGDRVRHRYNIK